MQGSLLFAKLIGLRHPKPYQLLYMDLQLPDHFDARVYTQGIAIKLVREHGQLQFYTPKMVVEAHIEYDWPDLKSPAVAMALFCSHEQFDAYYQQAGYKRDYIEIRKDTLQRLSLESDDSWMHHPDLDLDSSWLDLKAVGKGIRSFFENLLFEL